MPGIFLRDVASADRLGVQRFSSKLLFSHSEFWFGLPVPGGSGAVCWISSNSNKIWMCWRKSEGFSPLGKRPASDSGVILIPNAKVLVVQLKL